MDKLPMDKPREAKQLPGFFSLCGGKFFDKEDPTGYNMPGLKPQRKRRNPI